MAAIRFPRLSRFTLGTATFGMAYGVANPARRPAAGEVAAMLDAAWAGGITCLDTAPAYGEAETRIGAWRVAHSRAPIVVSKLPSLAGVADREVMGRVREAATASANRLQTRTIDGYLTHDAADYARPVVRQALSALVDCGLVRATGLSVYTAAEALASLAADPPDLIQAPINALDNRMLESGALAACSKAGVVVFARSIFLQGLFFLDTTSQPAATRELAPALAELREIARAADTTLASLALRHVRDIPGVVSTVVGVYRLDQLSEVLEATSAPPLPPETRRAIASLADNVPARLLDPRCW